MSWHGRSSGAPGARGTVAAVGALAASLLWPGVALAGVAECVAAHSHGQAERNAGHLQTAKVDFVSCSNSGCPGEIQRECVAFLAELEVYMPSVVFAAIDENGSDVTDVKVALDGQPVLDKLTGLATSLDPGSHDLVYTWPDGFEQKQTVVVGQGEKNRRIELRREAKKVVAPAPVVVAAPPPVHKGAPAAAYVLGGLGALALGSFAVFAITGKSAEQEMDGCKPFCTQAQADKMRLRYLIADISLGVGVVSLGAGGYLYFRATREPSGGALRGGDVGLRGTF